MRMRALAALIVVIVFLAAGAWFVLRRGAPAQATAAPVTNVPATNTAAPQLARPSLATSDLARMFPTMPAACPEDPNDLAGIEGYAPGAGGAEKTGQSAVSSMGGLGGGLAGGSTAPPPPAASCTGFTPAVAEYFARTTARAAAAPDDGYDPSSLGDELPDSAATFTFVRDHIRTEAYAGSMRGAAGTLQARGGSPLDKAALLAAMLGSRNTPVQFVHAPLSDAELQAVLSAVVGTARPAFPASPKLARALSAAGVDAATRQQAETNASRIDALADQGIAAAKGPTDQLAGVLARDGAALASSDAAIRSAWAANLRDHWWLQVQENGAWVDWDPTQPDAKPGTHLGGPPQDEPVPAVPDTQKTRLTLRVTATAADRSPAKTLVEASTTTDLVSATPVTVAVGDRDRGSDTLADATTFTPSITIDGADTTGDPLTLDPAGTSRIAVISLQIETASPGQSAHVTTRTLLDRRAADGSIDQAWTPKRTAFAATTAVSMLVVSGDLDPIFVAKREADGLTAVRAFMAYVSAGGYGKQKPPAGLAPAFPVEALHYFEQDAIVRRRLEQTAHGRFFFDRPQVVMMHRSLALDGDHVVGAEQFDIVENGMAAVGSDSAAAVRANFTRGYLDTVIEQNLLAAPSDGGAIRYFAAAEKAGVRETVSTDARFGGTAIIAGRPAPGDGRAHIGWWQVDPATGNLVGRMDEGAGQGLVEYAIARANDWSTLYAMIQFYGDFFRCIAGAVEGPLAGREVGSAAAQEWFKQCAGAALCGYLEALATGEGFSRLDNDVLALIYNILDLSITGTKDAWGPTLGAVCSKTFNNPFGTPGSTG